VDPFCGPGERRWGDVRTAVRRVRGKGELLSEDSNVANRVGPRRIVPGPLTDSIQSRSSAKPALGKRQML